jgi:hypothetical protein
MKKRVLDYLAYVDKLIVMYQDNPEEAKKSLDSALKEHLVQIGFFAHERIIHLIVTVTFALLTVISLCLTIMSVEIMPFVLTIAFMVLLIPHIKHYYLLENSVQRMYHQYDTLMKIKDKSAFISEISPY